MIWTVLLLALLAFLVYVALKSGEFHISRSIDIAAPAHAVHPHINTLTSMNQWNPWATYDAKSKIAYEGPPAGPGAVYTWGGSRMGEGRFKITDTSPETIKADLTMIKPMAADNKVVFSLTPSITGTEVEWAMSGCNGFVPKLMHLFLNVDKMVGKEFEKGLAALKEQVERKSL
jgi:hypothetical protein